MESEKRQLAAASSFRKGNEAISKENWDYAIEMYGQAAMFDPSNLFYRQTLRGTETKKYNNNGTGAKMAVVKLVGIKGRIKKAKVTNNWTAVNQTAEEGLILNPWDAQMNADIGEACRNLGYTKVAVFGYQKAVACDPDNKRFNQALAELLEERGDFSDAGKVWEKICKIDPLDGEARSKLQQIAATEVLDRGGYADADTAKGTMAAHEVAKRLKIEQSGAADGPGMSEEADLLHALRKAPDSYEGYLKIAGFYKRAGKLEQAAEMLKKALDLSGDETGIREQLEDVELDQLRREHELAKETTTVEPDNSEAKQKAGELEKQLLRREIEVFRTRIKTYPADLRLKWDLGQRLMRVKKYEQAIPLIQQCVKDTRLECKALSALGKCFLKEKKGNLARRQFEKAVPKLNQNDEPELFLEVHYWLGRLCDEAGDVDAAEDHYGEVLVVDYEYQDARERLENMQAS